MTAGRHFARNRVEIFVKAWQARPLKSVVARIPQDGDADPLLLWIEDLAAISRPRVVVRTLPQLQALAPGTVIMTSAGRAAQVEGYEDWDLETGAKIEAKRLLYVGTDLYDNLLPDPDTQERDTLRRMLPAIVIDPLD